MRDYAHLPVKQAKYVRTLLRTGNPPAVLPKPVSEVQVDINASMAALGPPVVKRMFDWVFGNRHQSNKGTHSHGSLGV